MTSILIMTIFLTAILSLALRDSRNVRRPSLRLFRAFFPSWRFFDRLEQIPKVFFRSRLGGGEFSAWAPLPLASARSTLTIAVNPIGNLELAICSLIERLAQEINESDSAEAVQNSVSYQLMERAVREVLLSRVGVQATEFQFKISVLDVGARAWLGDLLVSEIRGMKTGSGA